ncbi:putative selenate reductase subunit YgfK [Candidatus Neomarinimicrobiota bacterium]
MSDRLAPVPIERLARWLFDEGQPDYRLGIPRELFFYPQAGDVFGMERYGRRLETPLGVAAGPHTQLAQNIVAAWLMGARYLELKTVQTLDDIPVTKPCIDMGDEGYNCEWSQELSLDESFGEYLNAWILIHLLRNSPEWSGRNTGDGFIFNMSVGYNLEGILKPNVQRFLDRMADCRTGKEARLKALIPHYPVLKKFEIPDRISDNITLSTMHGCPPEEIEQIGRYFIEERGLNTSIKLNPTLLGPEQVRQVLNDSCGFPVEVPDAAFDHDLKLDDALALIGALQQSALDHQVQFGLKLTNTLETRNISGRLPDTEDMLYMSGRALHPISIRLAAVLQEQFKGQLDISFCAGVDCFNLAQTMACNLRPATVCTDLLKPGGYTRLRQYLEELEREIRAVGAENLDGYILKTAGMDEDISQAGWRNLGSYADTVAKNPAYHKTTVPYSDIKTARALQHFDCIQAPCVVECAIQQDVPGYMYHTARGEFDQAFDAIIRDNPLPHTTGMICDHLCQAKCTRINYEQPLAIRGIKHFIAEWQSHRGVTPVSAPPTGRKIAVIGAGPSGLSCAYFLAREGHEVHVFESAPIAGGMPARVIPAFRLSQASVQQDIEYIQAHGVEIHLGHTIDRKEFEAIRQSFDFIYLAVGAQRARQLTIPGVEGPGVFDQLGLLAAVHEGEQLQLGKRVLVIGGGDSAIDTARTALRLVGPDGQVTVVYRRTRKEMPASRDEVDDMLEEGVALEELTAPVAINREDGQVISVVCTRMKLGEPDESGRPRPVPIEHSEFTLPADCIVVAIGQEVILDLLPDGPLQIDPRTQETQYTNIFAGGDAWRGADSLINAMGDGKRVACHMLDRIGSSNTRADDSSRKELRTIEYQVMQARRVPGLDLPVMPAGERGGFELVQQGFDAAAARQEAARCLYCDDFCNICVTVCPNLAMQGCSTEPRRFDIYRIQAEGSKVRIEKCEEFHLNQRHQIYNIADFCNECGNCTTFCPTSGSPFQDKPRLCLSESSFHEEPFGYFVDGNTMRARINGQEESLTINGDRLHYDTPEVSMDIDSISFMPADVNFKAPHSGWIKLTHAVEMYILLTAVREESLFRP